MLTTKILQHFPKNVDQYSICRSKVVFIFQNFCAKEWVNKFFQCSKTSIAFYLLDESWDHDVIMIAAGWGVERTVRFERKGETVLLLLRMNSKQELRDESNESWAKFFEFDRFKWKGKTDRVNNNINGKEKNEIRWKEKIFVDLFFYSFKVLPELTYCKLNYHFTYSQIKHKIWLFI